MTKQKLFVIGGSFVAAFVAAIGFALVASPVAAQPTTELICDDRLDNDEDKFTDCADSDCSEDPACKEPTDLCHNIGGPDELGGGANCDPVTGECTITDEETGREFTITADQYFGIVISAGDNAFDAHVRHGDGEVVMIIDPPLHLSSQGQNHRGANVECIADRVNEQPEEPGN